MKPPKGSNLLRKGRASIKNQHYLLTTKVYDRKPLLNQEGAAKIVLESLHWLEKQGILLLDAAVVMPDHLHIVMGLRRGSLADMMRRFKGYTANKINKLENKKGPFWQSQYHDHALRQDEDLNRVVLYTLRNPVRAGLVKDFQDYPFWYCRWDV
jgi:REP element-mobilizing transposase RayT